MSSKTIRSIISGFHDGSITAVSLLEETVRTIQKNKTVNAFVTMCGGGAYDEARAIDARRDKGEKLHDLAGIPYAVKDLLCTRGMRTTAASRSLEHFIPPYDAEAVARLREAGAIVAGKTNLDEFAMGSSTEFSIFGPTHHPDNPDFVAGGSSGGSAVAVAKNMVPFALGTDTGGSVRQPAAFCGIVGMKPTYGRVSRYGVIAYGSSLDQVAPLARTVEDAAMVYEAIAGSDAKDSTSIPKDPPPVKESVTKGVKGMRIGVPKEFLGEGVHQDVSSRIREVIDMLGSEGAIIEEISLPFSDLTLAVYLIVSRAEASSNLARYDGVRYGRRAKADTLEELYIQSRTEGFDSEVKRRILLGTFVLSSGYADRYYRKATAMRQEIIRSYADVFATFDALVGPTTPETAFKIGEKQSDPLAMYQSDILTAQANVAGIPAISVPVGRIEGLPVGFQILAPSEREDTCFRVGGAVESLLR